jgi:hypothetical protein
MCGCLRFRRLINIALFCLRAFVFNWLCSVYVAYAFNATITTLCNSSGTGGAEHHLADVVRHTRRYVILTTLSFGVMLGIGAVQVFTNALWHVDTQSVTYFLAFFNRCCGIVSKVILSRVAKPHRRRLHISNKVFGFGGASADTDTAGTAKLFQGESCAQVSQGELAVSEHPRARTAEAKSS